MRNPFNWTGNKYRYLKDINELVGGKYHNIYEPFMGSGNIIVNIDSKAETYIGSDIIPLLPNLYSVIKVQTKDFSLQELNVIVNNWKDFSDKKNYYDFRDYWNKKYLSNNYDRDFIYETILLLKMCSNSMVRFNRKKGYFNQGFRGVGKGKDVFFSETTKKNIVKSLNSFKSNLISRELQFNTKDYKEVLKLPAEGDLVILDPPYILSEGIYDTDFTREDDDAIFEFLRNTKADFILFNYLHSGDRENTELKDFIEKENLSYKIISEKNGTGQGRTGSKSVSEVMIYKLSKVKKEE